MKFPLRFLLPLILLVVSARADSDEVISLARSFLGSEAALDAVESVSYRGTLVSSTTTPAGEVSSTTATIEILFAEPYYQRIRITSPERVETTALDDYEAWQRISNPADASQWRMTLLDTTQIRRLRANTWENLSFFEGLERNGGEVTDLGMEEIDGQQLRKLSFDHGYGIVFYRFYDPRTGRLVRSETDTGAVIVESGENIVAGVRFPDRVVTVSTREDGTEQRVQVDFERVEVNVPINRADFRVPTITRS
jgi:hypothetical protein